MIADDLQTTGIFENYKIKLDDEPIFVGSLTIFIASLILGVLFLILPVPLGWPAFFLDVAFLSFIFLIVGILQQDRVKNKIFETKDIFINLERNVKIFLTAGVVIFVLIILSVLSLISTINYLQQTIIAIVAASNLILVSIGLTLTTRVRKFANFAQAEFVIVGIYVAIAFEEFSGRTDMVVQWIFFQMILAFVIAGIVGVLSEIFIFGPLTKRNATPLSLMVASIGLGLIIRQSIQEIFGSVPRTSSPRYPAFFDYLEGIPIVEIFFADRSVYNFFNKTIRISRDEAWTVVVMVVTVYIMHLIFTRTTMGISMRATADDADLAQITGINTQIVIYFTWFLAAGVSGMGALFFFEAAQIQPGSGFVQLLLIFAVVILGGFDSFEGTLISGFILSFSMSAAVIFNSQMAKFSNRSVLGDKMVFWSTSGDWKLVIGFLAIILVLIFRPRGIFGLVDPKSKL